MPSATEMSRNTRSVSGTRTKNPVVGFGVVGEAVPTVTAGLTFSWQPVLPDEDKDGIGGSADECPLLKEDKDGFEDTDGCPDLDNDKDSFPDDEDRCPLKAGDDFSEDGC